MPKEQFAVVELISNIILGKTDVPTRVSYFPQKPEFPFDQPYQQPFPRATPESQGISSDHLASLLQSLAASKYTDMHHLMILRHGKVICECNFAPYPKGMWHITHSMCKSITGMAIGLLVEEGLLSLDENIYDIFADRINPLVKIFRPVITVENLLTMSSGVSFNESGIVSGNDWLSGYLNSAVNGHPGENFQYNSLNTYVLSAIVTRRTGQSLTEYLDSRLFQPLGITRYFWETCPAGITKGGWGMFLCAEDMAKLGELYLHKGVWNGKQIIPASWVEISTSKQIDSLDGTFGYGYQIWMEERLGSFEFNGMLGQNVIVYPDMDMVIVTNAGNNELFQNCVMLNIIREYFPLEFNPDDHLPDNPAAQILLNRLIAQLENGSKTAVRISKGGWPRRLSPARPQVSAFNTSLCMKLLNGRKYVLSTQTVGLFPLVMQIFHNNMAEGVKKLEFMYQKGSFFVSFEEANQWHILKVGFGCAQYNRITLHEETYHAAVLGTFTTDENGTFVLKLEITYVEEAVKRRIHIFFHDDVIETRWYETPGKGLIIEGLESVTEELANTVLFSTLRGNGSMDMLYRIMEQTIEPVVYGQLEPNIQTDGESHE